MSKPDWVAIRFEYITTSISYRQLSHKSGVSLRTLAGRAKREGWVECRAKYGNNLVTNTVQKLADKVGSLQADNMFKLQSATDNLINAIDAIFEDVQQFNRHLVTFRSSTGDIPSYTTEERIFMKVDTKAIRDLARALKELSYAVRNVYNLPTLREQAEMEHAEQRARMLDHGKDVGVRDYGVSVVSFTEEK